MSHRCDPDACSACGFPRSESLPHHSVLDGSGRLVCDRCWHNPALFFIPRELEIHGSHEAVAEKLWMIQSGVKPGQLTLFSCIPEFVRKKFGWY